MNLKENMYVKGKYRVLADIDYDTKDYPKQDGKYIEDNVDYYIPCTRTATTKITYYGLEKKKNLLCAYTSLAIWQDIKSEVKKHTVRVFVGSSEVDIYFEDKDLDIFAKLLKARTKGATVEPYDSTNLAPQLKQLKKLGEID